VTATAHTHAPQGTLSLSVTTVSAPHILKPITEVFSLPYEGLMDRPTMRAITHKGFSRVPVYVDGEKNNIVGYLLVKVN
jgi:CBS domain containing-hemolysin-like protein